MTMLELEKDKMKVTGNVPLSYSAERNEKYGKYATGRGNKDHFMVYSGDTKYGLCAACLSTSLR